MGRRNRWQLVVGFVAAIALAAATACNPAGASLIVDYKTTTVARLTPDGKDIYDFQSTYRGMVVTAPRTNTSATLRMVGYQKTSPASVNQVSCATWFAGTAGRTQPGVALRIAATPSRVRAITITNNVLYDVRWLFNIHLGDSAASPEKMTFVKSLSVDWAEDPIPWRFCARAQGQTITLKVWPLSDGAAEPSWTDPDHTVSGTVPKEWVYAGRPGWFAGHLSAGQRLTYTDLATRTLPET